MIKFKKIKILPSEWELDIVIGKNKKKITELFHAKYGGSIEYYDDNFSGNSCVTCNTTKKSETKGHRITVIWLEAKTPQLVIHELVHAMWQISSNIGYEMNYDTQEWQAILFEYLYTEIMKTDYQTIK